MKFERKVGSNFSNPLRTLTYLKTKAIWTVPEAIYKSNHRHMLRCDH